MIITIFFFLGDFNSVSLKITQFYCTMKGRVAVLDWYLGSCINAMISLPLEIMQVAIEKCLLVLY